MPLRAVLWDIDDTLFDYAHADHVGMRKHLLAEGLVSGFASVDQALRRWKELTEIHWRRFEAGGIAFEEQRRDRVRDFVAAALSDAEADDWFGRYLTHFEAAWALFPDVLPVLDALATSHRHGVLSNSSLRNQDRKLRVLGVRDRFEAVLCAEELGHAKPAAEAFHAACAALDLPPADVAYVGDRLDIDALGARDAGLTAVWLDRKDTGDDLPPDVRRIAGLAELPALLRGVIGFGAPSTIR
ncbi:HAD family hydrolase [Streptomyces piniterrae]|uniref:HAD family hydrolase n=1 Tax=Streptomyces piniterrae TaxID=2571125 RepID=A0A4U0MYF3_9ACTN|nr:HAD family hydrolase [Streptomyces piniterrae]TJZ46177.1 HAD family hydrolase [Streptomyces piniterrae]